MIFPCKRAGLDQFYALVTGQEEAFYKMCLILPKVIEKVVNEGGEDVKVPHDSVMSELRRIAEEMDTDNENLAMALAVHFINFIEIYFVSLGSICVLGECHRQL